LTSFSIYNEYIALTYHRSEELCYLEAHLVITRICNLWASAVRFLGGTHKSYLRALWPN